MEASAALAMVSSSTSFQFSEEFLAEFEPSFDVESEFVAFLRSEFEL